VPRPDAEIPEGLPRVGETLAGKYTVRRLIACGGMGAVYEVHHEILDQAVALKVLLPEAAGHAGAASRFINEARASARIRNEHVAQVMDVGRLDDGSAYIVLELLRGSDLARLLEDRGPLPIEDAVDYVLQACEAVAEAHALGIIHRDLKPANLFLAQREKGPPLVKVLDFGISKLVGFERKLHGDPVTDSRALLGSPSYMSPEQVRSSKHIDARSDIWSLGVILYRLIGKEAPFDGDNLGTVLASILESAPVPLRTHRPDVPPELESTILRCLDRNRDTRFQSVDELAEALAPFAPARSRYSLDRIRSTLGAASRRASTPPVQTGEHTITQPGVRPTPTPTPATPAMSAGTPVLEPNAGKTADSWSESRSVKRPRSWGMALPIVGLPVLAVLVVVAFKSFGSHAPPPQSEAERASTTAPPSVGAVTEVAPRASAIASSAPVTVVPVTAPQPTVEPAALPSASAAPKAPPVANPVPAQTPAAKASRPKPKSVVDDSILFNRK